VRATELSTLRWRAPIGACRILLALTTAIWLPILTSCNIASRQGDVGPVTISSFTAAPTVSIPGAPVVLTWVVSGATSLSISDGSGPITGATAISGNSVQVSPTATTTYTLTATGPSGSTSTITSANGSQPAAATVTVVPLPVISSFTATPSTIANGQSTTLTWSVSNAVSLSLEAQDTITGALGSQDVTGLTSITEQPGDTTNYTLFAISAAPSAPGASSELTVTVNQIPKPVIQSFTATNQNISPGETSILTWTVLNAVQLTLYAVDANHPAPGLQTNVTGQSDLVVSPTITTTYTLVAANSAGVQVTSAPLTIDVSACPPPNIYSFAATPPSTGPGNPVSLNAVFDSGASGQSVTATIDNGIGTVTSGDPVTTPPLDASITFHLTATNGCGSKSTAAAQVPVGSIALYAGQTSPGSQDGTTTTASFSSPQGLATDSNGNIYVADDDNDTIRMISLAGEVTTIAGVPGTAGYQDGPAASALFTNPVGVAVDSSGNVYVADTGNDAIRVIAAGTGTVTTLAGGTQGYQDGTGTAAAFYHPSSIAIGSDGNLYVVDRDNNVIRVVTPAGVVTTLAGAGPSASNPSGSGYADGTGSAALFNQPNGIIFNTDGNLYVTDASNYVVREITLAGVVTTIAGQPETEGSADGSGDQALFGIIRPIVADPSGTLYVGDYSNYTVRRLTLLNNSWVVDTIIGTPHKFLINPSGVLPGSLNQTWGFAIPPSSGNIYMTIHSAIYSAPY
jgi:serine/threonine protein kinase, bacterial